MEKGNFKSDRRARVFDLELKLDLVNKIEKGELKVLEVSRIYGVSETAVRKWLYKYSGIYKKQTRVIVEKQSISKKNQQLKEQVNQLERCVGQKQLRIDYLEKLLEVSSQRLGEDIEKKIKRLP